MRKLIFLLAFVPGLAVASVARPVLFEIQSPAGVTSYLFGTYHYGIALDEFPEYLRRAQDRTQMQIAEADMREIAETFELARIRPKEALARLNRILKTTPTTTQFTPAELDQLVELGIPREFAAEMSVEACFQFTARRVFFLEPFHSLESELEHRAAAAGKPIVELDTDALREEAAKYDTTPPRHCDVRDYLKDRKALAEADQALENARRWYRALTPERVLLMADDEDESTAFRNQAWMKVLVPTLQTRSAFISVGAAHLIGAKGLLQLLRAQGFTVRPYDDGPDSDRVRPPR